ncbi:DUF58 domain-containing protein [Virgibacillus profundi]|uniref:DUF58 domain-containing protein n=1 Tax=Virgibacillus profundi TaxID=2024555 RepID=A0A2A2IDL9_9BACI|nr:DUF58 domain-containing protein [Virgibacillus profundi]PAV29416.1 DUF58 domain-containing protein [Virgibacillus profundi]PXY53586.1 DUF58 domain-containing protein [Virgibacillus profundi]
MKELLTSTLMYRLSKHQLQSGKMKRGHHKGGRRSTRTGTSLEFSDYRNYQPGDDLRLIDWNVFARTNKHYIKRFLDEQELVVSIYVDCSKSMAVIPEKWKFAKGLAAALGYLSLSSDDRVGVFPIGSETHPFMYKKGRAFSNRLVHYMDELKSNEDLFTLSNTVSKLIQPRSSVTILISDLLEPIEEIEASLKKLQAYKQELFVIQVLTEEEMNPAYQGDLELIDSETSEYLNVTMSGPVKRQYQNRLKDQTDHIQKFCHMRGIGFVQCQSNYSLEEIIFKKLTAKGWIK